MLASVVVVWAGSFSAIKHLLDAGLSAPEVAASRYLVAAPGFVIVLFAFGGLPGISRRDLGRVALAGLLVVAVYHISLNLGEERTTSGTAAVIIGTAPGMTLGLAIALGLERFSAWRAAGLGFAFSGVVVVVTLGSGQEISLENAKGPLLVLLAPLSFALYNVIVKPLVGRIDAAAVSSAANLLGTLALLPLLRPSSVDHARALGAWDWTLVLYLGLICTLFAYNAWGLALRRLDASRAVAYLYGVPVLAVVIGALTLGEKVTVWLALGAALVVGGVAVAQVRR
jgi:drug/metabolite transporter (DMT)-like permease